MLHRALSSTIQLLAYIRNMHFWSQCVLGLFHTFLCIAPLKCLCELMYKPLMSHCGLWQVSCDSVKDELACYAKDYKWTLIIFWISTEFSSLFTYVGQLRKRCTIFYKYFPIVICSVVSSLSDAILQLGYTLVLGIGL